VTAFRTRNLPRLIYLGSFVFPESPQIVHYIEAAKLQVSSSICSFYVSSLTGIPSFLDHLRLFSLYEAMDSTENPHRVTIISTPTSTIITSTYPKNQNPIKNLNVTDSIVAPCQMHYYRSKPRAAPVSKLKCFREA
jgi:hypothetical protein